MQFIKPKNLKRVSTNWALPEKTVAIVKHYAEYTGYSEEEVLTVFLENLMHDKAFVHHVQTKRNNKRILKDLELEPYDL